MPKDTPKATPFSGKTTTPRQKKGQVQLLHCLTTLDVFPPILVWCLKDKDTPFQKLVKDKIRSQGNCVIFPHICLALILLDSPYLLIVYHVPFHFPADPDELTTIPDVAIHLWQSLSVHPTSKRGRSSSMKFKALEGPSLTTEVRTQISFGWEAHWIQADRFLDSHW